MTPEQAHTVEVMKRFMAYFEEDPCELFAYHIRECARSLFESVSGDGK